MFAAVTTRPRRFHAKFGVHAARPARAPRPTRAPRGMSLAEALSIGLGCDAYKYHRKLG